MHNAWSKELRCTFFLHLSSSYGILNFVSTFFFTKPCLNLVLQFCEFNLVRQKD